MELLPHEVLGVDRELGDGVRGLAWLVQEDLLGLGGAGIPVIGQLVSYLNLVGHLVLY